MPRHDSFFKRLLRSFFPDLLRIALPLRGGEPGVSVLPLPGVTAGPGLGSQYVALGLSGCDAAAYLGRPEPLAWALAALMNPGKLGRSELATASLRRILEARLTVEGRDLLIDCVATYLELTPEEISEYATFDTGGGNQTMRLTDMSFGDRLRAEGRREGLEQGARKVLLRLLTQRFGRVPVNVKRRVEEIDSVDRLVRLAERVLSASSLEDLGLVPKRSDA